MQVAHVRSTVTREQFRFACPACGEQFRTDAEMRDLLLDEGCALCGAQVTAAEFTAT